MVQEHSKTEGLTEGAVVRYGDPEPAPGVRLMSALNAELHYGADGWRGGFSDYPSAWDEIGSAFFPMTVLSINQKTKEQDNG